MPLRKGHGAGIVPAVDDLGRAVHGFAALRAFDSDFIDVRLVKFDIALDTALLFQFRFRADRDRFAAVVANPDGERRTPVTLAGKPPVDYVLEEVAHSALADRVGNPVDGSVVFEQSVPHLGHADEPRAARVVQKRRVAAPAERITVRDGKRFEQQSFFFQIFEYEFVGFFTERAGERSALRHVAAVVHHLHERQIVLSSDAGVVLAERGRDMNYAGAFVQRDVAVGHHAVSVLDSLVTSVQRLIGKPLVARAFLFFDDGILALVKENVNAFFREDIFRAFAFDFHVVVVGVHTQRHVGRKRPGRGRPG